MIVYSALLAVGLLVSSPWWLWRMLTSGRYRQGLAERLGRVPAGFSAGIPGRRTVWIHAVSVGEVLAVEHLLRTLQAARPDLTVAISTTTATGQKIARERFPDCLVFFFPLDFAFAVRAWLRVLQPALLVLVEGELWPRMLHECARTQVPVVVVNARVSDRSFRRTRPVKTLWLRMARHVHIFLAQGPETAERLRDLGVEEARIAVTGNLKYDLPTPEARPIVNRIRELVGQRQLVVAGSTLAGEEQMLLEAWPAILRLRPQSLLLLAPRHPQRFQEVLDLAKKAGNPARRAILSMTELTDLTPPDDGSILILDTLGDLAAVYQLASIAFVGGSLIARGGHNPLEPARFGVPVLMGPSYENFREMVEDMLAAKAIRIVTPTRLAEAVTAMLFNGSPMGERGRIFCESQSGATARTLASLLAVAK